LNCVNNSRKTASLTEKAKSEIHLVTMPITE
jgi:hypothetical protein